VALVIAASPDNAEAERLRNAVRACLLDGQPAPDGPQRFGAPDPGRQGPGPVLRWHVEQRPAVATLHYFEGAASIILVKQGYSPGHSERALVMGRGPGGAVILFAVPGPTSLTANVGVLVVGDGGDTAGQLAKSLCRSLIALLFE
jgi:hypothetical protein